MAFVSTTRPFHFTSISVSALRCNFSSSFPHTRKPTSSISENEPSYPNTTAKLKESLRLTVKDRASLEKFLRERCKSSGEGDITSITPNEALCVFDYMLNMRPSRPPVTSFNILFGCLAKTKHYDTVLSLFKRLNSTGLFPNLHTYSILINCFCKMGRVSHGFVVLGRILRSCFTPDAVTFTSLIKDGLCKEGFVDKAKELLLQMKDKNIKPNVVTYTSCDLMSSARMGRWKKQVDRTNRAKELFVSMESMGCKRDVFSYSILINGYCKNKEVDEALSLHSEMLSKGIKPTVVTYGTLFLGLFEVHQVEHALKLFDEMQHVVTYNIMIHGLCNDGKMDKAHDLFLDMEAKGVEPDCVTFNTLMLGFIRNNETSKVIELLHRMDKRNVMPDASTLSIVVDLLVKNEISLNSIPQFKSQRFCPWIPFADMANFLFNR
ncbi:pentatricopeptide repeat-containing protein [Citrus sinensis]|uniref:Pentatricopeptide repeat-containing protein n=1 Tax=Citrus sinensis TaxID=2711 RepID=A0ACB8IHW0_CITSI|nr:pentatricopeptide repeat-containing protein [Citrus sinensis]